MGIYVFKRELLVKLLKEDQPGSNDFGGEIIPKAAENHKVGIFPRNDPAHCVVFLASKDLLHTENVCYSQKVDYSKQGWFRA